MDVSITTFTNPFSFYCRPIDETGKNIKNEEANVFTSKELNHSLVVGTKKHLTDVSHGQYVAVLLDNEWTRGIITMESQFLIWLIDHGVYLRPTERTVYKNLPSEFKKWPTKVFEASIHGVTPVDKIINDECQIVNEIATSWNNGAMEKVQKVISMADKICFVPVALLSTKQNDIVLGDLYIRTKYREYVNIADELEMWPVFLQKNKEDYIQNLSKYYTSRRRHHACNLKPAFPGANLAQLTLESTLLEYSAICDSIPQFEFQWESDSDSEGGSTVVGPNNNRSNDNDYKLTAEEIEQYSSMYVKVCGREFNVLKVLLNKIRDLKMCAKYKDLKSVGRANTFAPK